MGNVETVKRDIRGDNVKKYLNKIKNSREVIGILNKEMILHECNRNYIKFFGCGSKKEIFMYGSSIIQPRQTHLDMLTSTFLEKEVDQLNIKKGVHDFKMEYKDLSENSGWVHVWITSVLLEKKLLFQVVLRKTTNPYQTKEQEQESGKEETITPTNLRSEEKSIKKEEKSVTKKISQNLINLNFEVVSEEESEEDEMDDFVFLNEKIELILKTIKNSSKNDQKKRKKKNRDSSSSESGSEEEGKKEKIEKKEEKKDNQMYNQIQSYLEKIHLVYKGAIESRDQKIGTMSQRLQSDRMEYKNKYEKLETHFQRRLGGLESEIKSKEKLEKSNIMLKEKVERLSVLIKNQNQYQKEISKFI
ncbi:hypothetical protein M0813_17954 [Anaeramoeba flamelloides]|uniref:Uncharacterized protein n=1 Tax=Anaeramoeba flamelloides TaxID=1746091 RepID=A0ABQ8YUM3_9EUKA|nr:hypothetical protein M0813_17954 [Anaeramoeba flamelloides]